MDQPRILVVEDDPDDRALFLEALDELGLALQPSFAYDAAGLLAAVQPGAALPDLVLLDLNLPDRPGLEVLVQLRAEPRTRALPVLAWTTSWSEVDIAAAYQAGINGFVIKPLRFPELVDQLQRTFDFWLSVCQLPAAGALGEQPR